MPAKDKEKARAREMRWKAENPDKVKKNQKRYDDKRAAKRSEWYKENKEKHNAQCKTYRDAHPEYEKARAKAKAARYRAKGWCHNCTTPRLPDSNHYCEKHWFGNIATQIKKRSGLDFKALELGPKLLALLKSQDYRCAYTGEELVPGVNASLDHIVPISYAANMAADLNNMEWVSLQVNLMKREPDRSKFLDICCRIAEYHGKQPQKSIHRKRPQPDKSG